MDRLLSPSSSGPAPMNRSKAQVLADHLQEVVREQRLESGHSLGTRAQLRESLRDLGATGATIDGAIRILADRGIIRVKSGIGGGIFVDEPNAGAVLLAGGRWQIRQRPGISRRRIGELIAVVHGLYPMVMAEAAMARTDTDIDNMRAALGEAERSVDNVTSYELAHHDLHQVILAATHSEVLIETLNPLLVIHHETMEAPTPPEGEDTTTFLRGRVEVHRAIVDAIVDSDCEAVWKALLSHGVTGQDLPSDEDMLPAGFVATQNRWRAAVAAHRD